MLRKSLLIASLLRSACVFADAAHPFAAPDTSVPAAPGTAGGIGQVTLALAIVLLAIFALGWLMRRMRGFARKSGSGIQVLSELGLGTRERAVVIKVGNARLLLGVAPGRVNLLHVLPEDTTSGDTGIGTPEAPEHATAARPTFMTLLQKSLGR